jgi:hypothetical protein
MNTRSRDVGFLISPSTLNNNKIKYDLHYVRSVFSTGVSDNIKIPTDQYFIYQIDIARRFQGRRGKCSDGGGETPGSKKRKEK